MLLALGVAIVSGVGAVCRYVADQLISHKHGALFPWGTFAINVVGSFVLGLSTGLATHHGLSTTAAAIIGSGFCAGFTTFSTWMWETLALAETGAFLKAGLNAFGSLAIGLTAAGCGLWLALL
ncbi:MAG TPA: fluoride efflux transporter CrcB [Acidothermaceae bacterium]